MSNKKKDPKAKSKPLRMKKGILAVSSSCSQGNHHDCTKPGCQCPCHDE